MLVYQRVTIRKLEGCPLLQSSGGACCADALHTTRDDRNSSGGRQAIPHTGNYILGGAAPLRKWVYSNNNINGNKSSNNDTDNDNNNDNNDNNNTLNKKQ